MSTIKPFFSIAHYDDNITLRMYAHRSAVTYRQHKGEVLDIAPVENSHSMASISSDGAVHVWRVELAAGGTVTGGPGSLLFSSVKYIMMHFINFL